MSSKASKSVKTVVAQVVEQSKSEPLPDSNEDVAEIKAEFASYDEVAKKIKELDSEIISMMREKVRLQKEADRFHAKTAKEAKSKNKRKNTDVNRKPSGFETPVLIPEKFFKFITNGLTKAKFSEERTKELEELDLQSDSKISRSLVTKMAYDYIKHLNLYEDNEVEDKRFIKPDEQIKKLFSMVDGEKIEFKNFQTYVSRLFPKKQKEVEEEIVEDDDIEDDVEDDVEDDEEEVVPVKTKSKSKNASSSV